MIYLKLFEDAQHGYKDVNDDEWQKSVFGVIYSSNQYGEADPNEIIELTPIEKEYVKNNWEVFEESEKNTINAILKKSASISNIKITNGSFYRKKNNSILEIFFEDTYRVRDSKEKYYIDIYKLKDEWFYLKVSIDYNIDKHFKCDQISEVVDFFNDITSFLDFRKRINPLY